MPIPVNLAAWMEKRRKETEALDRRVLAYIADHVRQQDHPPTLHDIADEFGMSGKSAAKKSLDRLQEAGLITRAPGRPRAITLHEEGR